jgi:hypothetical protein
MLLQNITMPYFSFIFLTQQFLYELVEITSNLFNSIL